MKRFQYEITPYPAEKFTRLIYFCSDQGECSLDQLPSSQIEAFQALLNERGGEGWEMAQVFFGGDGALVIWKREI
jgi:hypothetical protein